MQASYDAAFKHFVEMEQAHALSDWDGYTAHRAALLRMRYDNVGAGLYSDPEDVFEQSNAPVSEEAGCRRSSTLQLTPAQVRVRDFLSPLTSYRSLLLVHGVGVGKTCTAISVIERCRHVVMPSATHASQRPLVLVPSSLKPTLYKQILDVDRLQFDGNGFLASDDAPTQCVGNKYLRMVADRYTLDRATLQQRVNAVIDRFYLVYSYVEFANELDRVQARIDRVETTQAQRAVKMQLYLKKTYSDRVVVVDEVHNLRSDSENSVVPPKIKLLISSTDNVQLLLMSATPMFDRADEIMFIVNLMLDNEKRPLLDEHTVFSQDGDLLPGGMTALKNAMHGRVSFVRGQDPREFPAELAPSRDVQASTHVPEIDVRGNIIPPDARLDPALPLVVSVLNGESARKYVQFVNESGIIPDEEYETSPAAVQVYLQVSSIAFPGTTEYGNQAFADCFRTVSRGSQFEYTTKFPFLAPPHVYEYAPKIATIVDRVLSATGVVLVYSNYIRTGVVPLAIALEHRGFQRVDGHSMLAGSARKQPMYNYVMLSGDKATSSPDSDIDLAKSPANADGSRVKVILMSRRGSEGWDMKNVREVHILEPWHNMSRIEQIKGRALRRCSHVALPERHRNVTVYMHVAVCPSDQDRESFDQRTYRRAQNKLRVIDKVMATLKRASIERALRIDSDVRTVRAEQENAQGDVVSVRIPYVIEPHVTLRDVHKDRNYQVQFLLDKLPLLFPKPRVFLSVDDVADAVGMDVSAASYCLMYISIYFPSRLVRAKNAFAAPPAPETETLPRAFENLQTMDVDAMFKEVVERVSHSSQRHPEIPKRIIVDAIVDRLSGVSLEAAAQVAMTDTHDMSETVATSMRDGCILFDGFLHDATEDTIKVWTGTGFDVVSPGMATSAWQALRACRVDVSDPVGFITHSGTPEFHLSDGTDITSLTKQELNDILQTLGHPASTMMKAALAERIELVARQLGRVQRKHT